MSLFTCRCDYCGKKRLKLFSKSYPSTWTWWKRYYFCSVECANNLVKADRDAAGKHWEIMLEAFALCERQKPKRESDSEETNV